MITFLNDVEVRVLGSLVEKQVTTPEYYPLTLNALTLACNQKSNRHPVMTFDEATVAQAVESLREKNLAYVYYGSGSRVPKYKHVMPEVLHLSQQELALLCVLMLRGQQTIGELKERASRLYQFSGFEEAEATLESLISKDPEPLATRLPRQPGQKEVRFAHLFSGQVSVEPPEETGAHQKMPVKSRSDAEKVLRLEQEVEALRADVKTLQQRFDNFKKQFE